MVNHMLEHNTRILTLLYLLLYRLESYINALVTDFSVRRIHNNKIIEKSIASFNERNFSRFLQLLN